MIRNPVLACAFRAFSSAPSLNAAKMACLHTKKLDRSNDRTRLASSEGISKMD
jgi:hypothetical protein